MTSTHAVAIVKRLFQAKRAGHAGTLDPPRLGRIADRARRSHQDRSVRDGWPQALSLYGRLGRGARYRRHRGPRHQDQRDQALDGGDFRPAAAVSRGSSSRPAAITPRSRSRGERAYDLARDGETVELKPRPVEIHQLKLAEQIDSSHSMFEAECGKGTYLRALARDLGRILGCFGHICALRRTLVGPFGENDMSFRWNSWRLCAIEPRLARAASPTRSCPLRPRWTTSPALAVTLADAARLHRGQAVLLRGRDAPIVAAQSMSRWQAGFWRLPKLAMAKLIPKRVFKPDRTDCQSGSQQ